MADVLEDYQIYPGPNPHFKRMQEILRDHPQVKDLFGPYRVTALFTLALVAIQLVVAVYASRLSWWLMLPIAYLVGATINHALFVVIHECTHSLVFKSSAGNRLCAMFANFPIFFPSAMGFFYFHMLHHSHQGQYDFDADLANKREARFIGANPAKKIVVLFFYGLVQAFAHTHRLRKTGLFSAWFFLNIFLQFGFLAGFYYLFGIWPLVYFAISTVFALGLHPLGGRWIQEHYVLQGGTQETYSYYGPLNRFCFNMGYHNEHHDFMKIPWVNLPKVKAAAPEYYDSLISYQSWTWVLWKFIFDGKVTFFNRITRPSTAS